MSHVEQVQTLFEDQERNRNRQSYDRMRYEREKTALLLLAALVDGVDALVADSHKARQS